MISGIEVKFLSIKILYVHLIVTYELEGASNAHRAPAAKVIMLNNGIYGLKVGYEQFPS